MKNYFWKTLFLLFFLLLNLSAFAQLDGPGTDNGSNTLQDDDLPQAFISGHLIWLAIVGIAFAFLIYRKGRAVKLD